MEAIIAASRESSLPLVVEAPWSARLPLCLHRACRPPGRAGFSVAEAALHLRPLLRAGLRAHLRDPELSLGPGLQELLAALEPSDGILELEAPIERIDAALLAAMGRAGVRLLELDLTGLLAGSVAPRRLPALHRELAARGITVHGTLVYGLPGSRHQALRTAYDACITAGVEDLVLHRLLVPPGCALQTEAAARGLRHAALPPYEVLSPGEGLTEDLMRSLRLARTHHDLQRSLSGTGLLRALAVEIGSAAEIVERFAEDLGGGAPGPTERTGQPGSGRRFLDFVRREFHLDLEQAGGHLELQRAPLLSLRWLTDGRRLISDDTTGRTAHLGRRALHLLDGFDGARTGLEVCEVLASEAPLERRDKLRQDLKRTLEKLVSMSFLVPATPPATQDGAGEEIPFLCFEEFEFHCRMLADTTRVEAFRAAIQRVVRPGMHVIEIGTGTGILAILAAQAGARVTAIERFSVLGIARAAARQSGVEERIHFIRGRSDLVELEERGDLLITEIVGNRILNEGLLEMTLDARRRLLRPGARLIPRRIAILAEVGHTRRFSRLETELRRLGRRYAVDLQPLASWLRERLDTGQLIWELGTEGADFSPLTSEVQVVELDLEHQESTEVRRTVELLPCRRGVANAVLLAFRVELTDGVSLSTSGRNHPMHWSKPVHMLAVPRRLQPGRPVVLRLAYETHGDIAVSLEHA